MQPQQFKLIAFDNDGTLYPAGPAVGRAVLSAHREYVRAHSLSIPTPDEDWLTRMIGADAKEFYSAMLPGQPPDVRQAFEEFCLDYEAEAVHQHPYMFDGAEGLLTALKAAGRTLVLVTNGPPRYVQTVWDACGYGRFFTAAYPYGPPDFSSKGERLRLAVEEHGVPAVMIGDRLSDRQAASEAGVPFIGCAYGYSLNGELDGAQYVVSSIPELYNLLLTPQERER